MNNLIGGILQAIGILIAGASGLCSLAFMIGSTADDAIIVFVVGGVPFVFGVGLFFAGRAVRQPGRSPTPPEG